MTDLAEFLKDRIAEDKAAARDTTADGWVADGWRVYDGSAALDEGLIAQIATTSGDAEHVARWDPARVLAECEAKQRIVELCSGADMPNPRSDYSAGWVTVGYFVLQSLALPYADHPDFDEAWRS